MSAISSPCSWLRRVRSSVVTSTSGGARDAPIAVEARADERLVGEVGADEQAGDPVEERGLGQRAGGRQQAVDRPLDAVGERRGGDVAIRPVAQPPAVVADPDQAAALDAGERVADEREQALDVVEGRLGPAGPARRRRAAAGGRTRRRRWPARSRPTRISPSRPAKLTGSPRSLSTSTAASTTARAASSAENGAAGLRSGGANSRSSRTTSGSPAPPGTGVRATFARLRGPPGTAPEPGGTSSTTPPVSRPASGRRAPATRKSAPTPPSTLATSVSGPSPSSRNATRAPRLMIGSTPRSARVTAAACQPHEGRTAGPNSGSRGASRRPRARAPTRSRGRPTRAARRRVAAAASR